MSFVVHRFRGIECRPASSSIHYEFVDPSVPLSINEGTGELSTKDICPNIDEVLVKCYDASNRMKDAYAKIIFDQICQITSIKQSDNNWINRLGEERRKRNQFQESGTVLVS